MRMTSSVAFIVSVLLYLLSALFCCQYISVSLCFFVFFQAEDGIRDLVRSRGLGDVYKRQSEIFDAVIQQFYNSLPQ